MKYKIVTEERVFEFICAALCDVMCPVNTISVPFIAKSLGTSKYQVRKHIIALKNKGFVMNTSIQSDPDWDECPLPRHGFGLTDSGRKHEVAVAFSQRSVDYFTGGSDNDK